MMATDCQFEVASGNLLPTQHSFLVDPGTYTRSKITSIHDKEAHRGSDLIFNFTVSECGD